MCGLEHYIYIYIICVYVCMCMFIMYFSEEERILCFSGLVEVHINLCIGHYAV